MSTEQMMMEARTDMEIKGLNLREELLKVQLKQMELDCKLRQMKGGN